MSGKSPTMIDSQNASARKNDACTSGLDDSALAKNFTSISNSPVTGSLVESALDSVVLAPELASVTSSLLVLELSVDADVVGQVEELEVPGAELVGNGGSVAEVLLTGTLGALVVDEPVARDVSVGEIEDSERGFSTLVGAAASAPVPLPAENERPP